MVLNQIPLDTETSSVQAAGLVRLTKKLKLIF